MKHWWLVLICFCSTARAEWHGLSLPDWSTGIHVNPIASREFVNGQWLAGYGFDVLYYQIPGTLQGQPLPKLYLAVDHQWNAADLVSTPGKAQGLWGPALGISIGGLASKIQSGVTSSISLINQGLGQTLVLPPWFLNDLDKWFTLEAGGGNRILGNLNGSKPWGAWVGGKVTIQFDVLAHH